MPGAAPFSTVQYRLLGNTGLRVSALAFGGSSLGSVFRPIDEEEGIRALHTAVDLGVNLIDTAPYYGATRAETVLGRGLRELPRDRFILATKVGRYGATVAECDFSAARISRSIDESLRRLNVDYIDVLQAHDIEFADIPQVIAETIPALQQAKAAGKARFIGITGLPLPLLARVQSAIDVDVIQSYCHGTLLDTALLDWIPRFRAGTGVLNSAPLAMRLLTDDGPPPWHPAPAPVRERCAAAARWCGARGASLAELALQYSLTLPGVHSTIVGLATSAEVRANVAASAVAPDPELLSGVRALLAPVRNVTWASGRPENQA